MQLDLAQKYEPLDIIQILGILDIGINMVFVHKPRLQLLPHIDWYL